MNLRAPLIRHAQNLPSLWRLSSRSSSHTSPTGQQPSNPSKSPQSLESAKSKLDKKLNVLLEAASKVRCCPRRANLPLLRTVHLLHLRLPLQRRSLYMRISWRASRSLLNMDRYSKARTSLSSLPRAKRSMSCRLSSIFSRNTSFSR